MNTSYAEKVNARAAAFEEIWNSDIDAVFSDVAAVYDKENDIGCAGRGWRLARSRNRKAASS